MNRDEWLRQKRMKGATWQSALIVYALIVGTMVVSAMAII